MSSSPELDALVSGVHHLLAGKYFQLAAFVMLIYDHILTFPLEVDRIWRRKFSGATLLFLTNRYVTPLQFIIILDAFHDPRWTKSAGFNSRLGGSHFQFANRSLQPPVIMILRVYALYNRSLSILIFLMVLWATQIAMSAVGLHQGFAVPLPPTLIGCILTGSSPIFPSVWVTPLATDTSIFALTLWRTRQYLRDSGVTPTMHIFIRDGFFYFLAIFVANLMNTLIYFLSPADLKAVGASFSQLITAVMVSRLVLNLRYGSSFEDVTPTEASGFEYVQSRGRYREQSFLTRTIGNLGEDLGASTTDDLRAEKFEIPLTSMALRRQLDTIPVHV
ncbi:hypothetical protein BDZ97DRAFT_1761410 [Flammula alnicola]|nr:hypothetical protein BDZ97DRAFT_1761410 [Flammula alnicola]